MSKPAAGTDPTRPLVVLPLRTWLVATHAVVFLLPFIVLIGTGALASDLRDQTRWDLEHQGVLLAMLAEQVVASARGSDPEASLQSESAALSDLLRRTKKQTWAGIRFTDAEGVVVATSGQVLGEVLSEDAEVQAALQGRPKMVIRPRPAPSVMQPLSGPSRRARVRIFVALPIELDGEQLGAVVLSRTPREELQALYQMDSSGLLWPTLAALAATVALAISAAFILSRSLRRLDQAAHRIAEGRVGRLPELDKSSRSHVQEVAGLADSVTTMGERLQARLAYISEFASNVSHEFKTPLATLRGTVELLDDDADMEIEQRVRFLHNAGLELDRLERLVTGLLTLARADEGTDGVPMALHEVLEGVAAARVLPLTGRAGSVHGDRSQLEAVVINLVDNARAHGGPGVSVRLEAFDSGGTTGVRVIDDGVGISEANLPRVFDRFFTTDRGGGGTGLGLALVRAICERHGGQIVVRSAPGSTVFEVVLPTRGERPVSALSTS